MGQKVFFKFLSSACSICVNKKEYGMIKTVLQIEGMMCGMCESHMNDLIRQNFTVKKVTSSAKDGTTTIISEQEIDLSAAEKKIQEIGYKLISGHSEPYEKKGLFGFGK